MLLASSEHCEKLAANTERFRSKMTAAGFTISVSLYNILISSMVRLILTNICSKTLELF